MICLSLWAQKVLEVWSVSYVRSPGIYWCDFTHICSIWHRCIIFIRYLVFARLMMIAGPSAQEEQSYLLMKHPWVTERPRYSNYYYYYECLDGIPRLYHCFIGICPDLCWLKQQTRLRRQNCSYVKLCYNVNTISLCSFSLPFKYFSIPQHLDILWTK